MVAIPTYLLPLEQSTGRDGGGGEGRDIKITNINTSDIEDPTSVLNTTDSPSSSNELLEEDGITVGGVEEEAESSTQLWCPRRGATPEQLRQLQVITLVVIGLIGLLIITFLLLCMFYKNERLLEKMPWRRKRVKKMKESGREISSAINTSLQAVPSMRIVPGAIDALAKNQGKHFPTHKTMLVDIGCRMVAGASSLHVPLGISPTLNKRPDGKVSTHLSSGAPDPNNRARPALNDSMMRRHHNAQCTGMGLSDSGHANPGMAIYEESSDDSWGYEEGETEGSDDEEGGLAGGEDALGYVAESRRGARGEKGNSIRCKNKYSDQYGSSMAKRRDTSDAPITTTHEVSYMSGRFW